MHARCMLFLFCANCLNTETIMSSETMTIDSGWVKILKKGVPQAFSSTLPLAPGVVFIDGQIKLMKGEHVKTWKQFVQMQFFNTIDRCFETGAHTVVLGFDNYKHVPTAKGMTQRKRSQHVPAMDFSECDDLPRVLPDYWDAAMRNRSFKVKVMAMVAVNVRNKYADGPGTVILDCTDEVEVLGKPRPLPPILCADKVLKRGECDIKAFAFLGNDPLLISSTDGDFVPLSLLQIEKAVCSAAPVPRVLLYRIKVNVEDKTCGVKRKRGREMEFVDMNAVYEFLKKDFAVDRPARCFAGMVASTGCDFTMNLPQIGPTRIWSHRHTLKAALAQGTSAEGVLGMMLWAYTELYIQKARLTRSRAHQPLDQAVHSFESMVAAVKRSSSISQRVRDSLWGYQRALAHAKNTEWTVLYWTDLHEHPDPIAGDFGFVVANGLVNFNV